MTVNTSAASPGAPVQVVAEQPVIQPLAGFIPWATPTLSIPLGADAQIQRVPDSCVALLGGVNHGVNLRAGADI
jgi:hypothetical protein